MRMIDWAMVRYPRQYPVRSVNYIGGFNDPPRLHSALASVYSDIFTLVFADFVSRI